MSNIQTIARQAAISLIALIGVTSFPASTQTQIQEQGRAHHVVIVHGALVDGSGWKDVYATVFGRPPEERSTDQGVQHV
jgi:hypothetical protein